MSVASASHIRENSSTCHSIPYEKYFEFFPYEKWSLQHYISLVIDNYEHAEKDKAHLAFFNTLHNISNDSNISQDIREIAEKLIENKKTDVNKVNSLWNKANKNKKKKQYVVPEMSHLFPNEDVPMQANGSVNILEVVKSVVRTFDKNTIAQGSFRSYKSSNHLCIDSKKRAKVPRESVYDAEMYRILHNWLVKVHGFEITGQWHLESICADGDFHHFYCDLTIKKHDATNPVAILELLATVSQPKLDNHFEQVFKYAEQLCPLEVWIVHFSREDAVVTDPYWPCNELQDKGLNVIHLWHNKEFTNVRMSSRSLDAIGSALRALTQTFEYIRILHKTMVNTQSQIDSLRELNSKLVAEIANLRKENTEIPELKKENASLSTSQATPSNMQMSIDQNENQNISAGGLGQNSTILTLAQLFDKAIDAECGAIRANQEEILRWCYYGKEFLIQVSEIIKNSNGKIGEKKAKGIVYDKILEHISIIRKKRSEDTGPDDFPEVELSESTITPIPSAHISKSSGLGDLPKTQGFNSDFSDNDEVNNWSATYSDNDDEAGYYWNPSTGKKIYKESMELTCSA
ncbi:1586_t:CDS:2 [Entrophospora sp. SA101]|nr:1586_t:CDS:2 [Entrophospora sp. SA101]